MTDFWQCRKCAKWSQSHACANCGSRHTKHFWLNDFDAQQALIAKVSAPQQEQK